MSVMVKALDYYSHTAGKALKKLKAHLNRPEGVDNERDRVTRREFLEQLDVQPERGVISHKLVFNLSQEERDRLGVDRPEVAVDSVPARRPGPPARARGGSRVRRRRPAGRALPERPCAAAGYRQPRAGAPGLPGTGPGPGARGSGAGNP